jgi:hypothetical protein
MPSNGLPVSQKSFTDYGWSALDSRLKPLLHRSNTRKGQRHRLEHFAAVPMLRS